MPRRCTVCDHARVAEINQALLSGGSFRSVVKQFSVSDAALFRHKKHLSATLVKGKEAQEISRADRLLAEVEQLRLRALGILAQAEQAGDLRTALLGVREARSCLEMLVRLFAELREHSRDGPTLIHVRYEELPAPGDALAPSSNSPKITNVLLSR